MSTHNLCFEKKYEKFQNFFLSENFPFLVVKFSVYLNRRVFVMSFNIQNGRSLKSIFSCSNIDNYYFPSNLDQTCFTFQETFVDSRVKKIIGGFR